MRLKNNPEAKGILSDSQIVIKNFPYVVGKNTVLELGMGKGEMISAMAKANPGIEYIGIEKYATVAERAHRLILENKLTNVKIINKDISKLPELISGKLKVIWLTFSDPWPKARHEKRRLTNKHFLKMYDSILDKDGVIYLKSDNDNFFKYSVEQLKEYGFKLLRVSRDYHIENYFIPEYMTGYENKWSERNEKINYLEARK